MTQTTEDRLAEEGLRVERALSDARTRQRGNYHVLQGGAWKVARWEPSRLISAIAGHWYIAGTRRSLLDGELDAVGPRILPPSQPTEFERELVAALRDVTRYYPTSLDAFPAAQAVLAKATERGL